MLNEGIDNPTLWALRVCMLLQLELLNGVAAYDMVVFYAGAVPTGCRLLVCFCRSTKR